MTEDRGSTDVAPVVSVVVPTWRRPDLLHRCLTALCAQQFDAEAFEIIVADDGPDDATREVVARCQALTAGAPRIAYLPVTATQGPAAARNAGWRCARAPVVAFTDDDTIPDPLWLRGGCAALLREPDAVAVAGEIDMPISDPPTDYERDASGLAHAEFATANCFVRRHALDAVGGFDERFTRAWREDADLMFALRSVGPISFARGAKVVHPVRPAHWGVSIGQQSKVFFDALLYKKYPALYRRHIRPSPPWLYYTAGVALLAAVVLLACAQYAAAIVALTVWAASTAMFCARRLRHTARTPAHVAEMIWTSIAIPPVSLYWRVRGGLHFRVLFL
ncbi:glycosyl transferase family 2 [Pandoraea faecigallinarum]|uniref:Glycosyl transferase family 2 n=1 Tax=Pandoraea faecigallinarum TaxID=656179 RepID=A0A0H3WX37_9BURK|nr:glycosyltransferase family A protein [Pandoraea faecigallinarum]AKM32302.1 glycosyl transferase family 2 [Pandoraea faecigallinarum]